MKADEVVRVERTSVLEVIKRRGQTPSSGARSSKRPRLSDPSAKKKRGSGERSMRRRPKTPVREEVLGLEDMRAIVEIPPVVAEVDPTGPEGGLVQEEVPAALAVEPLSSVAPSDAQGATAAAATRIPASRPRGVTIAERAPVRDSRRPEQEGSGRMKYVGESSESGSGFSMVGARNLVDTILLEKDHKLARLMKIPTAVSEGYVNLVKLAHCLHHLENSYHELWRQSSRDEARLDSAGERSHLGGAAGVDELDSRLRSAEDAVRSEYVGRIKELGEALQRATEQATRSADLEQGLSEANNKLREAEILAGRQVEAITDLEGRLLKAEGRAKSAAELEIKLKDAEGRAKRTADLKERLHRAEDQAKRAAENAEGARDWARSTEAKYRAVSADLGKAQVACTKLQEDLLRVDEARARAEAKCSSAQVEILRISEESSKRVLSMATEIDTRALEKAEAIVAERIAEAKRLAVDAFRHSAAYQRDLGEASADAYSMGFEDCRAKVSQRYPDADLGGISLVDTPYTPQIAESPPFSPPQEDVEIIADPTGRDEAPDT